MTGGHSSRAVLSLGSNLGDREGFLSAGLASLGDVPGIKPVAVSSVYESEAVGDTSQGRFLNAIVLADSQLSPAELMDACLVVEGTHGRIRAERWGPRTLDVDVIAVDDLVSEDPSITLPHPRAHERAFVLVPWAELDPDAVLPRWGRVLDLLGGMSVEVRSSVELYGGMTLSARRDP